MLKYNYKCNKIISIDDLHDNINFIDRINIYNFNSLKLTPQIFTIQELLNYINYNFIGCNCIEFNYNDNNEYDIVNDRYIAIDIDLKKFKGFKLLILDYEILNIEDEGYYPLNIVFGKLSGEFKVSKTFSC